MANIHTQAALQAIATQTLNDIKAGIESQSVFWSWGVSKKHFTEYNGMATLMLRVTGLYHKGWVYVSLNEGSDYYEVRLMNCQHKQKGEAHTDIFCEDLGNLIDRLVERGTTSDEEYHKKAMADSERKMAS